MDDGILLVVESGFQDHREYVLRALSGRHRLWLLAGRQPTWELPYLTGYTVVETMSVTALTAAVRGLRNPVAGVLCYDELRVVPAAELARALGLPGPSPEAARACRDKAICRRLLDRAGVPQPRSVPVTDLPGAARAAERIGYPVVVKPRDMAGSVGVCLVEDPVQLAEAVRHARAVVFAGVPRHAGFLVEEYLVGPEVSVDTVVRDGRTVPVVVAHKSQDLKPTFEETGHLVRAGDDLLADAALTGILAAAHRAIGWTHGITHTEIRLTPSGPRIVEINGRFGGDLIPYLGQLATGVDLLEAAAALALGGTPALTPGRTCAAGIRWLYPAHDMRVTDIHVDWSAMPPGLWELKLLATPGQRLRLPPRQHVLDRLGLAVAVGDTAESCRRTLDLVPRAVRVTGTRLPRER
ncbi:ATP-grasp domain-containing protein [Plantactinospora sp. WMMB334]|uniref:ATP-grasp domain-containing protein n=1 Tax=Plantactinospora sp. WMMB334 TaxID=3404119 RepID=UPI003B95C17D